MFNSFNSHIVCRHHHQLVKRCDEGESPKNLLEELLTFHEAEHRTENRIHDQAVFSLDPHSFD